MYPKSGVGGSLNCCESTCKLYTHTHGLPCLPHFAKPRCAIKIEVIASMKAGQIPRIIPGFWVGGGPDLHLHDLLGIFEAQHGQGSRPGQQSNLTGMGSVALIPVKLGISHICRYIYNWGIRWEVCTYHIHIIDIYIYNYHLLSIHDYIYISAKYVLAVHIIYKEERIIGMIMKIARQMTWWRILANYRVMKGMHLNCNSFGNVIELD